MEYYLAVKRNDVLAHATTSKTSNTFCCIKEAEQKWSHPLRLRLCEIHRAEIRRDRLQTDGCWNFRRKGMGRNFLMGEGFCLGVTATFWNHNRGHSGTIL